MGDKIMSLVISEFDCKCGCGQNFMNPRTFDRFLLARSISGVVYIITSGYRCWPHNNDPDTGGSLTSSHPLGFAGDIKVFDDEHRWMVFYGLQEAGFKRIRVARTFIHADDDPTKHYPTLGVY